ncbi:hypothetical protein HPP92_027708 [Vanilla planifolia]|uniref:Uncharacterized protein n=1 Tax=Vanilla planifolia TaxID=51239 RepID=A0A835PBY2_VANPL|nr:hypothetical protein HPP92_027708 [Vanilla planifolia]
MKTDVSKPLQPGNLQVLSREKNVFSPTRKNIPNPTNFLSVQTNSTAIPPAMIQSPIGVSSPKFKVDGRSASLGPSSSFPEKKPSQVQNRNDFFNSLRKKSHANQPTNANNSNTSYDASPSNLGVTEQLGDNSSMKEEEISLPDINLVENSICSAKDCEAEETEKLALDEKEAAFLRSLGWEENAGEEALTREEIESFLLEYNKLKPAVKLKI